MPRREDDDQDDDRPARRRPRDDDEDAEKPARSRRPRDDDEPDEDRPRRRGADDDDLAPPPKKKSSLGLILGIVGGILFLCCGGGAVGIYYGVYGVRDAAVRMTHTNDLKQISVACHNHASATGSFPNNSYDANGKPLLSWRVHILPYIEQDNLYRQFKLNEPWDSLNNRPLLDRMPPVYATQAERGGSKPMGNKTYYRGFSSPGAAFARRDGNKPGPGGGFNPPGMNPLVRGMTLADIKDGASNTILVLEAGDPVEWSKPDDLDASPGKPFPALGGARPKADEVLVLFADGSVRAIKRSTAETNWRAGVTIAGNDQANLESP